jgi:hypothetical protein
VLRVVGTKDWISLAEEEVVVGEGLAGMGISRPLVMAMAVALLIAVAGATAEEQEPLLAADAVAGAVEAALGEVETAALRAELGQLRAKISALGQCPRLESTGRA